MVMVKENEGGREREVGFSGGSMMVMTRLDLVGSHGIVPINS